MEELSLLGFAELADSSSLGVSCSSVRSSLPDPGSSKHVVFLFLDISNRFVLNQWNHRLSKISFLPCDDGSFPISNAIALGICG